MRFFSPPRVAALLLALLPCALSAPAPVSEFTERSIADSFIVVYKQGLADSAILDHLNVVKNKLRKRDLNLSGIGKKYSLGNFKGYQINADTSLIEQIAALPQVAYVEPDHVVKASALTTQAGSTYGLARISHRNKGANGYVYDTKAGQGSRIYVVDTGIRLTHTEFGGRAVWGKNFINGSPDTDENGHGTHCSGTAAGKTYGVAKAASLYAVKVLDKDGSGATSGVMSGIEFAANNATADGVANQAVISMSLGGPRSSALNDIVEAAYAKGVTVAVAAGNDGLPATFTSPASAPDVLTVGAIDSKDARASFSNFGSELDLFAPGVDVLSAWKNSDTDTNTISGTSMATPHVAGLSAYLISVEGLRGAKAVNARVKSLSTKNKVSNPGLFTVNAIAYNGNGA